MCSMCHYCGGELSKSHDGRKQETVNPGELNNGYPIESCRFCFEKQGRDLVRRENPSPMATPSLTPTTSLSSSDRTFSSEFSVDGNPYDRVNQEECTSHSSQEDMDSMTKSLPHDSSLEGPINGTYGLSTSEGISDGRNHRDIVRDVEIQQSADLRIAKEKFAENCSPPSNQEDESNDGQMDSQIWEPPEPENPEDELENTFTNSYEDDDDCGDGAEWSKSSSLTDCKDEKSSGSYKFKEEKQRAMQEVIDRKFKALVSQLLKTVGVSISIEDDRNWVDIVTTLSWEAASLLKPAVIDGKLIDPNAYVKVKCIATGSRNQSQVFRGVVFKKHAAHKHMPTKYKNPRLLLVQGVLGHSSNGLSSFESMGQEKDYVKPIIDMIEMCRPNVILVEKSVSRVVQESLVSKGITLVYDMKLHRLERVARCFGSPIVSSDSLTCQKLKQCDSFQIEKFVEEHAAVGEGGKKPSKTLMFLEGCPTHLGCTILLKGSHSDELKRIKEVVQHTVAVAYRLTLETSFLIDQQTMFSTIPCTGAVETLPADEKSSASETGEVTGCCFDVSTAETRSDAVNVPISNGIHELSSDLNGSVKGDKTENGVYPESVFYQPYNPAIFTGFSSLSSSLRKVIGSHFPSQSLSAYLGLEQTEAVPVSMDPEVSDHHDAETKGICTGKEAVNDTRNQPLLVGSGAPTDEKTADANGENQEQKEKDIEAVLDSDSILVLMSRRNAFKGIICEQSHFSHIMFYKNFDVPLGKFLRDNLFNQGSRCKTCEEPPESHFYYYAHHNKQLTIQIKQRPEGKSLPGEKGGKLWMWSRCGKCTTRKGTSKSTKRVLISTAARSLSFGKFLELSFSQHSFSSRLSSCGHSLYRDFLHFFGLGTMVAMFRYSRVTSYTVSLPPKKLEFNNSIKTGWLEKEFENVCSKGISLFEEVARSLKRLSSRFTNSSVKLQGSPEDLSKIEEMLKKERSDFEENIKNAFEKIKSPDDVFHKLLSLNRVRWELLLEAFIWDRRLHSLLLLERMVVARGGSEKNIQEPLKVKLDGPVGSRSNSEAVDKISDAHGGLEVLSDAPEENGIPAKEISIYGPVEEPEEDRQFEMSNAPGDHERGSLNPLSSNTVSGDHHSGDDRDPSDRVHSSDNQEADKLIPITTESGNSHSVTSGGSNLLGSGRLNEWFWLPFPEIRNSRIEDLEKGYFLKFEPLSSSTAEKLLVAHRIISEEGSRLHISLGDDHCVVSDYEGELSSLIACALALSERRPISGEDSDDENKGENGIPLSKTKHQSLDGFLDTDSVHSKVSVAREDSRFPSFDGLTLLESLSPPEGLRRQVSFGDTSTGKSKYLVICLYADEFRDLRKRCCPSELDYIASLSRCKTWDAKGGKSKALFAKTLDDRFIIKEIKKTEYDSFVKFAPDYFKYMNDSYDLGNQTCLAKVLGIYQVVIRQSKSGKEIKHDLMVMENLNFGRKLTRQYDLKGALHARYTTADGQEDVLLDQNFVNDMNASPLYVSNSSKRILQRAVYNDTSFLNSINVMDYSLLVGVDTQQQELVCGIIDYLRQYTWDKQLETWVKSSLVVPKNILPTVISPKEYKKRFRKFMSTHFLSVPDHWCEQGSSDPCKEDDNHLPSSKLEKQGIVDGLSTNDDS